MNLSRIGSTTPMGFATTVARGHALPGGLLDLTAIAWGVGLIPRSAGAATTGDSPPKRGILVVKTGNPPANAIDLL
jgi:hypothetical protein